MLEQFSTILNLFQYQNAKLDRIDKFNSQIKKIKDFEAKLGIESEEIKLYANTYPKLFRFGMKQDDLFTDLINMYSDMSCPINDNSINFNLFGFFPLHFSKNFGSIVQPDIKDYLFDLKLSDINFNSSTKLIELEFEFCSYNRSDFTLQRYIDTIKLYSKCAKWVKDNYVSTDPKSDFNELKYLARRNQKLSYLNRFKNDFLSVFEDYSISIKDQHGIKYNITYGSKLIRRQGLYKNDNESSIQRVEKFTIITPNKLQSLCDAYISYQNDVADKNIVDINNQIEILKNKFKK